MQVLVDLGMRGHRTGLPEFDLLIGEMEDMKRGQLSRLIYTFHPPMSWKRAVVKRLPESLQRVLVRHYLVTQICRGRRVAEGEIFSCQTLSRKGTSCGI